ncbi:MAG: cysteine--tRNA ligase [Mycoplasmataceae bacterium]|nr:cysteine--tRNA ligase [Mycoplasmataceae bacterium]
MKLYDSLSNKTFDVVSKNITVYNCGPTVYNDIHIGNARPLVAFDALVRFMRTQGYTVTYIHNITDIDDKIINKAKEEKTTESAISTLYYEHYLDINKALNTVEMQMPKVSQNVDGIIKYISKLVDAKAAYVTDNGDVYFDISSVKNYGVLSHQNIEQLKEGVRKELAIDKRSPLDFVLWKKTETGLNWKSPWSVGRPGWHTECAFFINKLVGDHVTIHGGGIDLKFPHHENENAQNNALYHRNIADIWMHVGHVNVNDEKMAKSLGNFVLVKDILTKYTGNDVRWFLYQTKYQNPMNFTPELFEQSSNELLKMFQQINQGYVQMIFNDIPVQSHIVPMGEEFIKHMNNDLDIPNAKVVLWEQVKKLASYIRGKKFDEFQKDVAVIVNEFSVLGIQYVNPLNNPDIHSLIEEWKRATNEKDYILSDKYRQTLIDKKVI